MEASFDNERPIYLQLVEHLKLKIIMDEYKSGDKIPSVRDLAIEYKVNPNTIQKALNELEDLKFIYTERTNGKFVTTDKKLIIHYKDELASTKIDKFLNEMQLLGFTKEDLINNLRREN